MWHPPWVFSLSYNHFPHLRGSEKILSGFIYLHVCVCNVWGLLLRLWMVKLNHIGSIKSAGFSCWDTSSSHLNNLASAIGVNFHNLIIQQRALNSKMTRAELKSGSFATGSISNLDNECRVIPCCSNHRLAWLFALKIIQVCIFCVHLLFNWS